MSIRVFGWDANPKVDRPAYKLSSANAAELRDSNRASEIDLPDGRKALLLHPPPEERYDSRRSLIPFVRVLNKLKHPPSINYPIPACGARTRPLYVSDVNFIPDDSALALS